MIKWTAEHIETQDDSNVKVKIGVPSEAFWKRWRTNKDELKKQGYQVFCALDMDKKKVFYVKKAFETIDKLVIASKRSHTYIDDPDLFWYQMPHLNNLLKAFKNSFAVADISDTGTGKTPVAVKISKYLKMRPAILCPLPVIPTWKKWCKKYDVKPLFIANYEALKSRKGNPYGKIDIRYYPNRICKYIGWPRVDENVYTETWEDCLNYLEKNGLPRVRNWIHSYETKLDKKFPKNKARIVAGYAWKLPKDTLLIYDEAHKCKGPYTQNAEILISSKSYKILLLSATLAETPRDLRATGYVLGLHNLYNFDEYTQTLDCFRNKWEGWECLTPIESMLKVRDSIIPFRGSRMRIEDIPDFPKNQIIVETYQSDATKEYNKRYTNLLLRIEELNNMGAKSIEKFTEIVRFRQAAELLKAPLYAELARMAIENGKSVPIFINYKETRHVLQNLLKTSCCIYGEEEGRSQSPEEREYNIQKFQHGKERVIIIMASAGGTGIDLHDVYGNYPRESIISPSHNARDFKQILGRIWRSGSKSMAIQRVVYLNGTVEDDVCETVNKKLSNISAFNDGDLMESDLLNLLEKEKEND